MLHWIYIIITALVAGIIIVEVIEEEKWRNQLALALILIPLILRVLHIK